MKRSFPTIFSSFVFILVCTFTAQAQTVSEGTIVNINQSFKVAFTDILAGQVGVGDLVEIHDGSTFITYLQVIETSEVLTKLGFADKDGLKTTEEKFAEVAIGNTVKAFKNSHKIESMDSILSQLYELKELNEGLTEEIAQGDNEITILKKTNQEQENKIKSLNNKVSGLRTTLERMADLLDEKIESYEY